MSDYDSMTDEQLIQLLKDHEELSEYIRYNKIEFMFPDQGTDGTKYGFEIYEVEEVLEDGTKKITKYPCSKQPDDETWSRSGYPKSMEFFKAGKTFRVRLKMAANRIGKTVDAGCEVTYHMTGIYPHWWEGRTFDKPIRVHACGKDNKTVVDSLQRKLLGDVGEFGTGLIPRKYLDMNSLGAPQKADANVGSFRVQHISGGWSTLTFKTYDAGRKSFEGFESDFMWLDEEPPEDVYGEAAKRLMTTQGMLVMTFTPTNGITNLLETFFGKDLKWKTGDIGGGKYCVLAGWDDVPHLTKKMKDELFNLLPLHQRKAASQGIPELGSGLIYPVDHDNVFVDPFEIPSHWKRYFSMDFGWEDPTVVTWNAIDPNTNTEYQYAEHYMNHTPVAIHAQVIKQMNAAAGFNIPGICDPSGGGTSQADGKATRDLYMAEGVVMQNANNSLIPGIMATLDALNSGKKKIFKTCVNTKSEMSKYRTDNGKFKGADHAMDTLRYGVMTGSKYAQNAADQKDVEQDFYEQVSPEYQNLWN